MTYSTIQQVFKDTNKNFVDYIIDDRRNNRENLKKRFPDCETIDDVQYRLELEDSLFEYAHSEWENCLYDIIRKDAVLIFKLLSDDLSMDTVTKYMNDYGYKIFNNVSEFEDMCFGIIDQYYINDISSNVCTDPEELYVDTIYNLLDRYELLQYSPDGYDDY